LDAKVLSTGVYTVLRYISVTLYSLHTVVQCIETHINRPFAPGTNLNASVWVPTLAVKKAAVVT
jgi:hypothetical protein